MAPNVFSVPIFLVVLRETLEAGIIVAVVLAFLKQMFVEGQNQDVVVSSSDYPITNRAAYKAMVKQVWLGVLVGFLLCLIIGGGMIGAFYSLGNNAWSKAEYYYEGVFYLIAALIISFVGIAMLRVNKMQDKWRRRIADTLSKDKSKKKGWVSRYGGKYVIFILSFFTVAREGIEGIVFITGVSFSAPAKAVPLPVVVGLICGILLSYILYKGTSMVALQICLIFCTCLLYLVAAGLMARSVSYFEQGHFATKVGGDVAETGMGDGSYDITRNVWHVNCCSPEYQGGYGWGIFNGILGWSNTATYSSVIVYNVYWICVLAALAVLRYNEVKGHWPLMKKKAPKDHSSDEVSPTTTGVVESEQVASKTTEASTSGAQV